MSTFVDAVKKLAEKSSVKVKVFSYEEDTDFCVLWGLDDSEDSITKRLKCWAKELNGKELTVVIVYDGMPQSPGDISVKGLVGPHDWAMAASWSIYKNSCLQDLKLRILVLNVVPSVISFASDSLFAVQNALPWIQDYRVVGSKEYAIVTEIKSNDSPDDLAWQRQALPPESRDMKMFVEDLLNPKRILTTYPEGDLKRSHYIELTKNLWIQNLLKAENRHSVANLVAPTILASGLPNNPSNSFREQALKKISEGSLMRRALISTLREVGFLRESPAGASNANNGLLMRLPCDVFGRRKNIQFTLVDDQYDLGYHHILAYTLFGSEYNPEDSQLKCYGDLQWLIDRIQEFNRICDWSQPRYLFGGEEQRCDVLLLDLRLWEDRNKNSRSIEIKKILCAAKQLLGNRSHKALSKALSPEFARAFEAAKETSCNPDNFSPEALTLLPLLLSHIDRTLPIVLFTSSHQRVVLEMLQNFPNIITSFAKPLVSGYGEAISPTDSVSDLEDAIKKAIELHETRIAWKRICELEPTDACFDITPYGEKKSKSTPVKFSDRIDLRPRLAELFETCVFGNVYESISLPWEFLEYEVAHEVAHHGRNDRIEINPSGIRGIVAKALKSTRHAKIHGDLERDRFRDAKAKWVAVLQLLFLLDFIEGTQRQNKEQSIYNEPTIFGPDYILWLLAKEVTFLTDKKGSSNLRDTFIQEETEKAIFSLIPC